MFQTTNQKLSGRAHIVTTHHPLAQKNLHIHVHVFLGRWLCCQGRQILERCYKWGCPKMEGPQMDGLFHDKSENKNGWFRGTPI